MCSLSQALLCVPVRAGDPPCSPIPAQAQRGLGELLTQQQKDTCRFYGQKGALCPVTSQSQAGKQLLPQCYSQHRSQSAEMPARLIK